MKTKTDGCLAFISSIWPDNNFEVTKDVLCTAEVVYNPMLAVFHKIEGFLEHVLWDDELLNLTKACCLIGHPSQKFLKAEPTTHWSHLDNDVFVQDFARLFAYLAGDE